jgi:hypothetical protein
LIHRKEENMKKVFSKIVIASMLLFMLAGCASDKAPAKTSSQVDTWFTQWDDRSVYSSGLISAEQETLKGLTGATIYHIDVKIADDLASLMGTEAVRYTNRETTLLDSIAFQLYPNQLGGSVTLSNVQVNDLAAETNYLEGNSTVIVKLPAPLKPEESTLVSMDFAIDLPTTGGGNYGIFGFIDNILVLDGFYPGIPVYDSEGWHAGPLPPNADTTFNDASFYLVRVTAPADLVLITSGVEVNKSTKGKQQVATFAAGPARDFYIAGGTKFVKESKTIGETVVNSYGLSDFQKGVELALNTSVEALQDFSARYSAYPYTEFDVVSTPMQGATGIEYPGVVGINKLVYDPSQTISGAPAFVILETTVAHEVGHQWFYNMVGNDQANEPWVDESLTQYVTSMYFLDEYGQNGMDQYRESWTSRWKRVNEESIPIGMPAADYQGAEYSAIVYGRGPIFFQTLAKSMGQTVFDEFLLDYVKKYEWQISSTEDLRTTAEANCQCDLTSLFVNWVDGK